MFVSERPILYRLYNYTDIESLFLGCEERLGGEAWGRMSFSSLLDDRDGVLAFRAYLAENGDQSGSQQMRMWLILSGLERKYASKHSNSSPEDFVTWLVKVTEEWFKNSSIPNSIT